MHAHSQRQPPAGMVGACVGACWSAAASCWPSYVRRWLAGWGVERAGRWADTTRLAGWMPGWLASWLVGGLLAVWHAHTHADQILLNRVQTRTAVQPMSSDNTIALADHPCVRLMPWQVGQGSNARGSVLPTATVLSTDLPNQKQKRTTARGIVCPASQEPNPNLAMKQGPGRAGIRPVLPMA